MFSKKAELRRLMKLQRERKLLQQEQEVRGPVIHVVPVAIPHLPLGQPQKSILKKRSTQSEPKIGPTEGLTFLVTGYSSSSSSSSCNSTNDKEDNHVYVHVHDHSRVPSHVHHEKELKYKPSPPEYSTATATATDISTTKSQQRQVGFPKDVVTSNSIVLQGNDPTVSTCSSVQVIGKSSMEVNTIGNDNDNATRTDNATVVEDETWKEFEEFLGEDKDSPLPLRTDTEKATTLILQHQPHKQTPPTTVNTELVANTQTTTLALSSSSLHNATATTTTANNTNNKTNNTASSRATQIPPTTDEVEQTAYEARLARLRMKAVAAKQRRTLKRKQPTDAEPDSGFGGTDADHPNVNVNVNLNMDPVSYTPGLVFHEEHSDGRSRMGGSSASSGFVSHLEILKQKRQKAKRMRNLHMDD